MKNILILFNVIVISMILTDLGNAQITTWRRVYGGQYPDYGEYGIQTYDGGYIITASQLYQGGGNIMLKIDSSGNEEWIKSIDSTGTGKCIQQTIDSGYIIAGNSSGYAKLIKTDKSGIVEWRKLYPINGSGSTFTKIKILKNGNFIMSGFGMFPSKAYIVETDSLGTIINNLAFSNNSNTARAYDICESSDGSFYITGVTEVNNRAKTLLARVSNNFKLYWTKGFGTEGEGDAQSGVTIIFESENEFFITGSYSNFYSSEAHYTKIDSFGNINFQKVLSQSNETYSMCKTTSGNYAITGIFGTTSDDIVFLLLNKKGDIISRKLFNSSGIEGDFSQSIIESTDKGFLITGFTSYQHASDLDYNIYVIKTDSIGNSPVSINNVDNETPFTFKLYQNFPNPFNSQTKIKFDIASSMRIIITLWDIRGKIIKTLFNDKLNAGSYEFIFDFPEISSGVYFYTMNSNNALVDTKRMIFLK
ncbi:MAG: T9SS type A sorting domain-containing protein [Ignavibacteria bacterium]|nr:T9SS type A sorting domain-containing protein [Ignavibacteria bacterium]